MIALALAIACCGSSGPLASAEISKPALSCLSKLEGAAGPIAAAGDKLEIRLYERLETKDQQAIKRQEPGRPGQEFTLQTEITGFYEVQPNGAMTIPILGNIPVEGLPLAQIGEIVSNRFAETFNRPATTNVSIAERRPVFVVGPVAHSGTYPFTRGMTALHLIALAGGFLKPAAPCSEPSQVADDLLDAPNAFRALRSEAGVATEVSLAGSSPLCPGDLLVVPQGASSRLGR